MYNTPIVAYKCLEDVSQMTLTINASSNFPPFTRFAITSDAKGENILEYVSTDNLVENKKIRLYRNDFYLHYPCYSNFLIGFGSQDGGKLGNGKSSNSTPPTVINLPFPNPKTTIKTVQACRNYTLILDSEDQIHITGNMRGLN